MTIMLVVPILLSTLLDVEMMVTLDFGLMVSLYISYYFFEIMKIAALVLKHNIFKVNYLVFNGLETPTPI